MLLKYAWTDDACFPGFRVGHEDAIVLAPEFDRAHQAFNPYALRQLPRGEAMVRIASAEGELVEMHPDPLPCGRAERVKQQSRIHYGVQREDVEERLKRLLRVASERTILSRTTQGL